MSLSAVDLPWRPNVGAVIFNRQGLVFIARRTDMPGAGGPLNEGVWQCPQGGMDEGETPETAVLREVQEETGMEQIRILGSCDEWMKYDLPPELIGKALGGRWRGQTQKWFAVLFEGKDDSIRLDLQKPAEFDAWRWVPIEALSECKVGFKKPIYERLPAEFERFVAMARTESTSDPEN
ncbi:MAG: RNA pyrophosphohydrolase [Acetobacter sp.]|jgi:putative (di)nucleoside polyphosphate hydrolase